VSWVCPEQDATTRDASRVRKDLPRRATNVE
jgi:hypothetical protein